MIPLCHKCFNAITERNEDAHSFDGSIFLVQSDEDCEFKSLRFVGCKEEPRIKEYYDAKRLCPLLIKWEKENERS